MKDPKVGDRVYVPSGKTIWMGRGQDIVVGFGEIECLETEHSYSQIRCPCDDNFCTTRDYGPPETVFYDLTGGLTEIVETQQIVPPNKKHPVLCVRIAASGREKFWYIWDILNKHQEYMKKLYGDDLAGFKSETVRDSQMCW